jgi:IS30 family transposase
VRLGHEPRAVAFPENRPIHRRPDEVAGRRPFGHWEGDLTILRRIHGSAKVATVTERKTRFAAPYHNDD